MSGRILIVDDLAPSVKVLAAKLSGEFYDVLTAHDGPHALDQVAEAAPDLVLLDVMMPGMDGFEVCQRIKEAPETAHVPVILLTALSETSDRVRGLQVGADDFLTKPVSDAMLFARVGSLIRMKRAVDQWALHHEAGRRLGLPPPPDLAEGTGGRVAVVDGSTIHGANIRDILTGDGHEVTLISDFQSAEAVLDETKPDVVVISMDYEGEAPLRLISRLRAGLPARGLPILLIGDPEDENGLVHGLELGVDDCAMRPLDDQEIIARVRTQIRRKRFQERLHASLEHEPASGAGGGGLRDAVTDLHNRRYLETYLEVLLSWAREEDRALSLALFQADDADDGMLVELARRIRRNIREFDLAARHGPETLIVVMPDIAPRSAQSVCERIRLGALDQPVTLADGGTGALSLRTGVVSVPGGEDTAQSLIEAVERAARS